MTCLACSSSSTYSMYVLVATPTAWLPSEHIVLIMCQGRSLYNISDRIWSDLIWSDLIWSELLPLLMSPLQCYTEAGTIPRTVYSQISIVLYCTVLYCTVLYCEPSVRISPLHLPESAPSGLDGDILSLQCPEYEAMTMMNECLHISVGYCGVVIASVVSTVAVTAY